MLAFSLADAYETARTCKACFSRLRSRNSQSAFRPVVSKVAQGLHSHLPPFAQAKLAKRVSSGREKNHRRNEDGRNVYD